MNYNIIIMGTLIYIMGVGFGITILLLIRVGNVLYDRIEELKCEIEKLKEL